LYCNLFPALFVIYYIIIDLNYELQTDPKLKIP